MKTETRSPKQYAAKLKNTQRCVSEGTASVVLPKKLDEIRRDEDWRQWKSSAAKPFRSFREALTASQPFGLGLGQYKGHLTAAQCWQLSKGLPELQAELMPLVVEAAEPLVANGSGKRSKAGENKGYNITLISRGTASEYRLGRMKRDIDPKASKLDTRQRKRVANALKGLKSGVHQTIAKAYAAAYKVQEDSDAQRNPVDRLKMYWKRSSKKQRAAFIDFLVDSGEIDGD